jgi:hypothetical protein
MAIYNREINSYKGRTELLSVAACPAYRTEGAWNIGPCSEKLSVNRISQPGDQFTFKAERFVIPTIQDMDLSKHPVLLGKARGHRTGIL